MQNANIGLTHANRRQHQLATEWSHVDQSAFLGSEDTTSHLQASHEARRNKGGLENKNSIFFTKKLEDDGLPLLTEKIANKIWATMTWAVYEGDVPIMLALFVPFWGGEQLLSGEAEHLWGMAWDPFYVQRRKHKVGFHNRGVQWDTPMARWAGEGNDWVKLLAQRQPRKEDVIRSLLESMKQAVEKKAESNGTRPTKKRIDLPSLELDFPEAGPRPTLEMTGDCNTIVDWINGMPS